TLPDTVLHASSPVLNALAGRRAGANALNHNYRRPAHGTGLRRRTRANEWFWFSGAESPRHGGSSTASSDGHRQERPGSCPGTARTTGVVAHRSLGGEL